MRGHTNRSRPHVELLDDRLLLSTFVVMNTSDSGTGSLRAAITCSNSTSGLNTISFNIGDGGAQTINLLSPLPTITNPVIIDGTTQSPDSATPITINGTGVLGDGLVLGAGSDRSAIKGLNIDDFTSGAGIHITTNYNTVETNTLALDQTGVLVDSGSVNSNAMCNTIGATTAALGNGITHNQQNGILIGSGGAGMNVVEGNTIGQNRGNGIEVLNIANNTIGGTSAGARNFIFGNFQDGVLISGDFTSSNLVEGNFVGTDTTGAGPFGNLSNGIEIASGSSNIIGGTTVAARNVISDNSLNGVLINGSQNTVEGNYVGTDLTGSNPIGNGESGIEIASGNSNIIGGTTVAARNVISGNDGDGVKITNSMGPNLVEGNDIGTDGTGTKGLGNLGNGVEVNTSSNNTIGGTTSAAGNLISGNFGDGILLTLGSARNLVAGNEIGTNATGTENLANSGNGVEVNGSGFNTIGGTIAAIIGGTTSDARNIISANTANGVVISNSSNSNLVAGNDIGNYGTGTSSLGNGDTGIEVENSTSNTIGGTVAPAGNNIIQNIASGIRLASGATKNQVLGNLIQANSSDGVDLEGATGNLIGGTTAAAGNTISQNLGSGISLTAGSTNNNVLRNLIQYNGNNGVDLTAVPTPGTTVSEPGNTIAYNEISTNSNNGIELNNSSNSTISNNTIGGTTVDAVMGNFGAGVLLTNLSSDNVMEGNSLLDNQGSGVEIANTSQSNVIGGATPAAGNTISRSGQDGVQIEGGDSSFNLVEGNVISSSTLDGVALVAATYNTIGGSNTITRNGGNGISLTDGAAHDQVLGNLIGTDASGVSGLSNRGDGVYLDAATYNTIGGTTLGSAGVNLDRNIISGNDLSGISLAAGATNNQVLGNLIGTDPSGLTSLPNFDGVDLAEVSCFANTIGGTEAGAGNIISGNRVNGISFTAGASSNQVLHNLIGTNKSGTNALPNGSDGVNLAGVAGNVIGGTTLDSVGVNLDRNIISGNAGSGIDFTADANANLVEGNYIGTDVSGNSALGNSTGVLIDSSSNDIVGGTAPGAGNVISGNNSIGIQISNSLAIGNTVLGNLIGTNEDGTQALLKPLPNGFPIGVFINDSPGNHIGGTMAGAGNVISGFGVGVYIAGLSASSNAIQKNLIGTARNGNALNNSLGVGVYINGAPRCTVGGSTAEADNVIAGYSSRPGYGVIIYGSLADHNVVQGNRIGLSPKKRQVAGVAIWDASLNTVGGNTITGNHSAGVYIYGQQNASVGNVIAKNQINKNLYGILLYNAPNNGASPTSVSYLSLQTGNKFAKNQIAPVREFTGAAAFAKDPPLPASTTRQEPSDHAVRPRLRPSISLARAQHAVGRGLGRKA